MQKIDLDWYRNANKLLAAVKDKTIENYTIDSLFPDNQDNVSRSQKLICHRKTSLRSRYFESTA